MYLHLKTYREENKFYFTATCSAMAGIYIERESTAQSDLPPPPFETARALSQLFAVQCCQ